MQRGCSWIPSGKSILTNGRWENSDWTRSSGHYTLCDLFSNYVCIISRFSKPISIDQRSVVVANSLLVKRVWTLNFRMLLSGFLNRIRFLNEIRKQCFCKIVLNIQIIASTTCSLRLNFLTLLNVIIVVRFSSRDFHVTSGKEMKRKFLRNISLTKNIYFLNALDIQITSSNTLLLDL